MTPHTNTSHAPTAPRTGPAAEPGLKVHTQFLPVDRATQILLQQFI